MALKKAGRVGRLGLLGLTLVAILVLAAAQAGIHPPTASAQAGGTVEGPTVSTPMMSYQGRLVDPATGNPKPNGAYAMTFKLYDVASAGAALWTESKNVAVSNGLFTTLLGDTTALNLTIFDGRDLWLGVTVSPDLEAIPRIQIAYAPYALFSRNAALAVTATNANNAASLGGQPPSAYAAATHAHDAANITTGTLDYARFNAYGDLTTDARIGPAAGQVAAGNHTHAMTAKLSFPAMALNHVPGTVITEYGAAGLRWTSDYTEAAALTISRPPDWDGTSSVTFSLWFFPTTGAAGNVQFFIRPRAWNVGTTVGDATSMTGLSVPVNAANVLKKQDITIPATTLNTGMLWHITAQRKGAAETYAGDLILMSVELAYTSVR